MNEQEERIKELDKEVSACYDTIHDLESELATYKRKYLDCVERKWSDDRMSEIYHFFDKETGEWIASGVTPEWIFGDDDSIIVKTESELAKEEK